MAAQTDYHRTSIVKLNSTNYHLWKFGAKMLLLKEDLWDIVMQDKPEKPEKAWQKADNSAQGTIALSVEAGLHYLISECDTARKMWEKIRIHFERASYSSKIFLKRKLYAIKLEGNNMQEFILQIMEIVDRLRLSGETIEDNEVISMILCGLTDDYDNLLTANEGRDEKLLTLEEVKLKLLDEAKRREDKNSLAHQQQTALWTVQNRSNRQANWQEKICYLCKQPGHIRFQCPMYKSAVLNKSGVSRYETNKRSENINYCSAQDPEEDKSEYYHSFILLNQEYSLDDVNKHDWLFDSGASNHLCNNSKQLTNYLENKLEKKVEFANGSTGIIRGKGEITWSEDKEGSKQLYLSDVLYVPELIVNIISISQLCQDGYDVFFDRNNCEIKISGEIVAKGNKIAGVYKLILPEVKNIYSMSACVHTWHRRMCHRNLDSILRLHKSGDVPGFKIKGCNHTNFCKVCSLTKIAQKPFEKVKHDQSSRPFQLIHSDVCGPISPVSKGGGNYYVTLVDDFSRYCFLRVIKNKSDVSEVIVKFIKHNINKFGHCPQYLRSDGGGEYGSSVLAEFLDQKGIEHQKSVPYSPQQNGVGERINRTFIEMIKAMLVDGNLNKNLWGEAASTACYVYNRMLHSHSKEIPFQVWTGRHPDIKHLRPMGSRVVYYVPTQLRHKLTDSGKEGILLGYGDNTKGYRILDQHSNKIIYARSVSMKIT